MNIIVFINPTMQYIYTLEQETAEDMTSVGTAARISTSRCKQIIEEITRLIL